MYLIPQIDGNDSILSELSDVNSSINESTNSSIDKTNDKDLDQTDQIYDDLSPLPRIYVTNARSIFPKFNHFIKHLVNYRIGVAAVSAIAG